MKVHRPFTLHDALALMSATPTPTPVAGGTDLLVSWHHRPKENLALLDLSQLGGELAPMRLTADLLELGALTTYWDVIASPEATRAFPLLAEAARQVGAMQIQTRGTWAGNIGNASPAADGVPVLMAYDAVVVLQSTRGRREVPLDGYYTGYKKTVRLPDELIVAIQVPRRTRKVQWFEKVGARAAQTITKVGVAVVQDDKGWRVVANSVAPYVCRCRNMEAALHQGRKFKNPDEIRDILRNDIAPINDMRSTAAYRETVLSRVLFFRLTGKQ